jgi:hypothetical protein
MRSNVAGADRVPVAPCVCGAVVRKVVKSSTNRPASYMSPTLLTAVMIRSPRMRSAPAAVAVSASSRRPDMANASSPAIPAPSALARPTVDKTAIRNRLR